ncbi:hypothetical protein FAM09_18975 [Niastella caeni]|uniref:Uncharacterized protein n=1 Tax=Niastella caeni TaxID=2569763 RepID=A0A4S8HR80_9BACT|nr:hypothetical protein [Niastella caeni]THU37039.1 hypothetical protein FAM09_18975 [Niastella caeni]
MGLLERRAVKAFQDGSYPKLTNEINTLAGYPIEFEVNWDTLAVEEYSHLYEEAFSKVYFTPLINAIKEITVDDMGKEALKESLKKVVIKNEGGFYSAPSAYSFDGGVLTIDHEPCSNIDYVNDRSEALGKLLMKNL